jgi:hypothetical protein
MVPRKAHIHGGVSVGWARVRGHSGLEDGDDRQGCGREQRGECPEHQARGPATENRDRRVPKQPSPVGQAQALEEPGESGVDAAWPEVGNPYRPFLVAPPGQRVAVR